MRSKLLHLAALILAFAFSPPAWAYVGPYLIGIHDGSDKYDYQNRLEFEQKSDNQYTIIVPGLSEFRLTWRDPLNESRFDEADFVYYRCGYWAETYKKSNIGKTLTLYEYGSKDPYTPRSDMRHGSIMETPWKGDWTITIIYGEGNSSTIQLTTSTPDPDPSSSDRIQPLYLVQSKFISSYDWMGNPDKTEYDTSTIKPFIFEDEHYSITVKDLSEFFISGRNDEKTNINDAGLLNYDTWYGNITAKELNNPISLSHIKISSSGDEFSMKTPWTSEYTICVSHDLTSMTVSPGKEDLLSHMSMPVAKESWYDINGDGKLESYSTLRDRTYSRSGWMQLDDDFRPKWMSGEIEGGGIADIVRIASDLPVMALENAYYYDNSGYYRLTTLSDDYLRTEHDIPLGENDTYKNTRYYVMDTDNSGRKKLMHKYYKSLTGKTLAVNGDLSFTPDRFELLSWNEYNNLRGELTLSKGGDGVPGWEDMFGRDGTGSSYTPFVTLDMNGDGLPDMIDSTSGLYFLNTGMGSYVYNTFGGKTEIQDLNGDGVADFLTYDSTEKKVTLHITRPGNSFQSSTLLSGYPVTGTMWCYDFDHDGDVDILIPIDTQKSIGGGFLALYLNDGNGKFKQSETFIEGDVAFMDCRDIDADGNYEILALATKKYPDSVNSDYLDVVSYKITGTTISDTAELLHHSEDNRIPVNVYVNGISRKNITVANIDNSGMMRILLQPEGNYDPSIFITPSENRNERPTAPGRPTATYIPESSQLKLNWAAATDKETSPVDLTYEIRVGTAPGLDDVVAADATPDGLRRNLAQGANGHLLFRTFDVSSWPSGKYYISVQAVDPNMMGSPFSDYTVFEKKAPAAAFNVDYPDTKGSGDVINLSLKAAPEAGVTYEWNIPGAEILTISDDNTSLSVRFLTGGKKDFTLKATGADEMASSSASRYVKIAGATTETSTSLYSDQRISLIFDMDADGSEEYYNSSKFYEQDAEGNRSEIKKMYNTSLSLSGNLLPVDINRDGLVDFLHYINSSRCNLLINNDDKNLAVGDEFMMDYAKGSYTLFDMDNDGALEGIANGSNNDRYYIEFSDDFEILDETLIDVSGNIDQIYDFDGDGLPDIIAGYYSSKQPKRVYHNTGKGTFEAGESLPRMNDKNPILVGDFDNDGLNDYLYDFSSYGFGVSFYAEYTEIHYGNGTVLTIPCPDEHAFSSIKSCFDIDNNGMADFVFSSSETEQSIVIYVNPDYTYRMETPTTAPSIGVPLHLNNGKLASSYEIITPAVANARPSAPTELRAAVADGYLNIEWTPATDKETPSQGLMYNISVRHKDKAGEGAYLLSPMNLERDNISTPSEHRLLRSPRIRIPLESVTEGEYEIRVQTVDKQYLSGEFSEGLTFRMERPAMLETCTEATVNTPTAVMTKAEAASCDFGPDATVTATETGFEATWTIPGLKQLKVDGDVAATIFVHEAVDASFTLPSTIAAGARITTECASADKGTWETVGSDGAAVLLQSDPEITDLCFGKDKVSFRINSAAGEFTLRHTVKETYGEGICEMTATLSDTNAVPAIMGTDAYDDHAEIRIDTSSLPAEATGVRLYREGKIADRLEMIAELDKETTSWKDSAFLPYLEPVRYHMAAVLPYGESAISTGHSPVRLVLNNTTDGGINLRWSGYEGRDAASYRILAGDSKESLACIATVGSGTTSFTPSEKALFYAVEAVFSQESNESEDRAISNVANAESAQDALPISSITLEGAGGASKVTGCLKVLAKVTPSGATFTDLDWSVTDGDEFASVDQTGLVTALKKGNVTVTATARDGSGASGSLDLSVESPDIKIKGLELTNAPGLNQIFVGEKYRFDVDINPENATETPIWSSTDEEVATVDQNGLATGHVPGKVKIRVASPSKSTLRDEVEIEVLPDPNSVMVKRIDLDRNEVEVTEGDEFQLTATVYPENAYNKNLVWSSDNKTVATVDAYGHVKVHRVGRAVITATAQDGSGVAASCAIEGVSGVDLIFTHSDICDVYTATGMLVKKNATRAEVTTLTSGIYILRNGHRSVKVIVD